MQDTPTQDNDVDCGMFAIMCADRYSRGEPLDFCQADMLGLRIKVRGRGTTRSQQIRLMSVTSRNRLKRRVFKIKL